MSTTNGANSAEDADINECDGEKVVTMMDVLQEQEEFEEDANAVLGASDDKNCTYSKGYIKRQAIYACLTCCAEARNDPLKRAGVCLACSLTCHENHELVELYTKRNFRCDCGNPKFNSHPCQFTSNKTELNEDNKYNQNFSGLYCICHRPYPDPENPIDDEMIQCIICEDWLHSSHLDATVPSNEYAEMICKGCMDKNDFIHDYSDFAVNNELTEVNVVTVNGSESAATDINIGSLGSAETKDVKENKEEMEVDMAEKEKIEDITNEHTSFVNEGKISDDVMDTDKADEMLSSHTEDSEKLGKTNKETELNDVVGSDAVSDGIGEPSLNESENKVCNDLDCDGNAHEKNNTLNEDPKQSSNVTSESDINKASGENIKNAVEETSENASQPDASTITDCENNKEPNLEISYSYKETSELKTNDSNNEKEQTNSSNTNKDMETNENKSDESPEKSELNSVEDPSNVSANDENLVKNNQSTTKENEDVEMTNDHEKNNTLNNDPKESPNITSENDINKPSEENTENVVDNSFTENATQSDTSSIRTDCENSKEPNLDISDDFKETTEVKSNYINNEKEQTSSSDMTKDIQMETSENKPDESLDKSELNSLEETNNGGDNKKIVTSEGEVSPIERLTPQDGTELLPTESEAESVPTQNDVKSTPVENKVSQSTSDETPDRNVQVTDDSGVPLNVSENKRKLSTEQSEEEILTKKAKLDDSKQCFKPKGTKRRFKGATFWPSNFRQKLCTCNECISMYKDLSVLFLIDPEDTVTAYETLGKEKTNGTAASQYEKGLEALSSLDRIQQINALTEYNKMRDKLLDFLKSFKDRKEVVKEEDIKAFFAGMKPKREPDGVYFCR